MSWPSCPQNPSSTLTDEDVDRAFKKYLDAKFPFGYKMKFVAERFGVLPAAKP